jgi:hypothetical protein
MHLVRTVTSGISAWKPDHNSVWLYVLITVWLILITSCFTSLIHIGSLVTLLWPVYHYQHRTFSETLPWYLLSIKTSYFPLVLISLNIDQVTPKSPHHLKFPSSDFSRNSSPSLVVFLGTLFLFPLLCLEVRTPNDLKGTTSYKLKPSPFRQSLRFPFGTPIGLLALLGT